MDLGPQKQALFSSGLGPNMSHPRKHAKLRLKVSFELFDVLGMSMACKIEGMSRPALIRMAVRHAYLAVIQKDVADYGKKLVEEWTARSPRRTSRTRDKASPRFNAEGIIIDEQPGPSSEEAPGDSVPEREPTEPA